MAIRAIAILKSFEISRLRHRQDGPTRSRG
jgi:hypothetical protein